MTDPRTGPPRSFRKPPGSIPGSATSSVPDRGIRKVGPGVVEAFYDGYGQIQTDEYDYIGKMDGDVSFGPQYFETIFKKFDQDPYLGGASGKLFLDLGDGQLTEEPACR